MPLSFSLPVFLRRKKLALAILISGLGVAMLSASDSFLQATAASSSTNPPLAASQMAMVDIPTAWREEFPKTDFSRHAVPLSEFRSGGPSRDGIPAIDSPRFKPVSEMDRLPGREPVIELVLEGEARAYPLRVLMWHEIVNDAVGGIPVTVTYCPLCNTAIVFDRRLGDRVLDFGTSGRLRKSDLVMYDRQTESWWQQFTGEALVGSLTGKRLEMLPAGIVSLEAFKAAHPEGVILVPNQPKARAYGSNPYAGYDNAPRPFLYDGSLPEGISPMARVVTVADQAWSLALLRKHGRIDGPDGLVLTWEAGQASALDSRRIAEGRDVGTVRVTRQGESMVHKVTFAFVFHAFHPEGTIVMR